MSESLKMTYVPVFTDKLCETMQQRHLFTILVFMNDSGCVVSMGWPCFSGFRGMNSSLSFL